MPSISVLFLLFQVTCDLQALADQICPGLDFAAELGKMFLVKDETEDKNHKNSNGGLGKRKYPPLINPGQKEQPRKKTFSQYHYPADFFACLHFLIDL